MPTLEDSILVKGTPEQLFKLSQDYGQRLAWDRYLRIARLEGAEAAAKGAIAYCESRKGVGMRVQYISFQPPHQVAMEMTKGPWLFKKFSGSWRFKQTEDGLTRVLFRYNFKSKGGLLGKLFLDPVIRQLLKTDLRNRLRYFKQYAEKN